MKTILIPAIAANAAFFAAQTDLHASLVPIDGTISFAGTATADNNNLLDATKFTSFTDVTVGAASSLFGAYAGTAGASVTVTPFTFNPPNASTPIDPLWTFTSGGDTYTFDVLSLVEDYATPTALVLSGMGTAMITGPGSDYESTTGEWSLTAQTFGDSAFTFSDTTTAATSAVPEPGTTMAGLLMLLPLAVSGFRILRSRMPNTLGTPVHLDRD
jgi:hypothetical protein